MVTIIEDDISASQDGIAGRVIERAAAENLTILAPRFMRRDSHFRHGEHMTFISFIARDV